MPSVSARTMPKGKPGSLGKGKIAGLPTPLVLGGLVLAIAVGLYLRKKLASGGSSGAAAASTDPTGANGATGGGSASGAPPDYTPITDLAGAINGLVAQLGGGTAILPTATVPGTVLDPSTGVFQPIGTDPTQFNGIAPGVTQVISPGLNGTNPSVGVISTGGPTHPGYVSPILPGDIGTALTPGSGLGTITGPGFKDQNPWKAPAPTTTKPGDKPRTLPVTKEPSPVITPVHAYTSVPAATIPTPPALVATSYLPPAPTHTAIVSDVPKPTGSSKPAAPKPVAPKAAAPVVKKPAAPANAYLTNPNKRG